MDMVKALEAVKKLNAIADEVSEIVRDGNDFDAFSGVLRSSWINLGDDVPSQIVSALLVSSIWDHPATYKDIVTDTRQVLDEE